MSDTTEKKAADAEKAPAEKKAADAEKAPAEKKAAAAEKAADGVTLTRGDETVTAYKPGTVTSLKAQGWKVAE